MLKTHCVTKVCLLALSVARAVCWPILNDISRVRRFCVFDKSPAFWPLWPFFSELKVVSFLWAQLPSSCPCDYEPWFPIFGPRAPAVFLHHLRLWFFVTSPVVPPLCRYALVASPGWRWALMKRSWTIPWASCPPVGGHRGRWTYGGFLK